MNTRILTTLFLSIFIALLGIGIIIPVMPVFATELGASGIGLSLIIAAFSISRGILQPVIGSLSDRWGRKPFLLAGLAIYGAVGLAIPLAQSVGELIAIRTVHGIGSAMIVPVAMAYVSFLSPAGHEARYQSYLNVAIFSGIGCGPILGGLVAELYGFAGVFHVMALAAFMAMMLVFLCMPSAPGDREKKGKATLFDHFSHMIKRPKTRGILLARFSTMLIMVPSMAFLPLYMSGWQDTSAIEVGIVIGCRTLVNALLQIPFGSLADRYSKLVLLLTGAMICGCALIIIPKMTTFLSMTIVYSTLGFGEAIIWPVLGSYASIEAKKHYGHGTMMGVYSFAMSGGVLGGSLIAGTAMDTLGLNWAFVITGYCVIALTIFSGMLIYLAED